MCCTHLLGRHVTSTPGSSSPEAPADGHTSTLRTDVLAPPLTTAHACREVSQFVGDLPSRQARKVAGSVCRWA